MAKKSKEEKEKDEILKPAIKRLSYAIQDGKITFFLDGVEVFFFERNDFLELTNRDYIVERLFREEMQPDLSLEETARISRLSRKGLSFDMIAKILELDALKLKRGFQEAIKKHNDTQVYDEERRQCELLGEKDFLKTRIKDQFGILREDKIFIDLKDLKRMMRFGQVDKFIKDNGIDSKDFQEFLKSNQKYLDLLK